MKKIIFLAILLYSFPLFAQKEHLKFKNIPITGTISNFSNKLVAIGYVVKERKANKVILSGAFVGENNCKIEVVGTGKSHITYEVNIYLPKQTVWYSLESKYFKIKEQYEFKYGKGGSIESFKAPFSLNDGNEIQALETKNCLYNTMWFFENIGLIDVKISETKQIVIGYQDYIGYTLNNEEEMQLINSDI